MITEKQLKQFKDWGLEYLVPIDKNTKKPIPKKFYSIIKKFYNLTGVPALLNTSLNLHGYPVASSLKDVAFTFKNSDLKFLYINDNFLIAKKC